MASNTSSPKKPWTLSRVTKAFFSRITARTTGYGDLFKTIGALLVLGAAVTGIAWLTGFVTLTVASMLTLYATAMLVIAAIATFNYCFAAKIMQASLKARPCLPEKEYGLEKNRMNIKAMGVELIRIANDQTIAKDESKKKIQLPEDIFIGLFKDEHESKITSVYGITRRNAGIFIPSGVLMSHTQKLTQMEMASLMMVEILKIRNAHARRGIVHTIGNIGLTFASLIEDLDHSSWFLGRLIATVGSPFQLVSLFYASRLRTYQYEAIDDLIKECGIEFGADLKRAYVKLGLPWENPALDIKEEEPRVTRNIRARVYDEAANTVFNALKGWKEANSEGPAAGNVQAFLVEKLAPATTPRLVLLPALERFRPAPSVAPAAHAHHVPAPTVQAPAPTLTVTTKVAEISIDPEAPTARKLSFSKA